MWSDVKGYRSQCWHRRCTRPRQNWCEWIYPEEEETHFKNMVTMVAKVASTPVWSYKSGGVVVLDGLRVAKGLQYGVGLQQLFLQLALTHMRFEWVSQDSNVYSLGKIDKKMPYWPLLPVGSIYTGSLAVTQLPLEGPATVPKVITLMLTVTVWAPRYGTMCVYIIHIWW